MSEDGHKEPREQQETAGTQEADRLSQAAMQESARRTRRSFLVGAVAAAGGFGLYHALDHAHPVEELQSPLREALQFNATVSRAVFQERGLAPTYPVQQATDLRVNGNFGLERDLDPDSWRLQVVGVRGAERLPQYVRDVTAWQYRYRAGKGTQPAGPQVKEAPGTEAGSAFQKGFAAAIAANGTDLSRGQDEAGESASTLAPGTPGLLLTLAELQKLPHQELVTQFKCIEGWSQIVHWGGVRLADFLKAYPPARNARGELPRYVYMETPDGNYYTGYTREACEHPQSLLVTEMGGQPLTMAHGAPLRLHMPIKYGYKQIKRIGLIAYTDQQPDDYWTKLGYDWYAGL